MTTYKLYKNDRNTREIMLMALLHRPWKNTDFVREEEHGYMCPISVMKALAGLGLVHNNSGVWTLTEAGLPVAQKIHKKDTLRSLVKEHGGRISHKEVKPFHALVRILESLQKDGKVERRAAAWHVVGFGEPKKRARP